MTRCVGRNARTVPGGMRCLGGCEGALVKERQNWNNQGSPSIIFKSTTDKRLWIFTYMSPRKSIAMTTTPNMKFPNKMWYDFTHCSTDLMIPKVEHINAELE
jgi:hypothetical protein